MTHYVATPPVVNYSSSTKAARAAPDPPTHPPKDPRCTAAAQQGRTAAVRDFVDADVTTLLHRSGISMFFPCFYDPPPYLGQGQLLSTLPAPSSRCLALGPVLSPATPRADGCCVGWTWHGRAAAGGRVPLGRAVPERGIPKPTKMSRSKARRR